MTQRLSLAVVLLFSAGLLLSSGCGGTNVSETAEPTSTSGDNSTQVTASNATNSVPATKSNNSTSPASVDSASDPDASPEQVCQRFMKLMRSGNRIAAENLLTRTALTVTTQAGLQLEPMGGPTAVYKVGAVKYATNKQRLAQVECSIVDNVEGEEYEMNVTWLVRKQSLGWRISGVMLELESGQVPDLLSFENIQDVNRIKSLAGEDIISGDQTTRQADASTSSIK
jgi:hypothetical protein